MRRRTAQISVAAAVVVTLLGSAAAATAVIDTGGTGSSSSLCAEFTDTVGLYEGNSVTMLGAAVGTVTGI